MDISYEPIPVIGSSSNTNIAREASPVTEHSRHQEEEKALQTNRCLMAIEHPTVKVPYEVLNRKFRTAQKTLEREVMNVSTCVAEVQGALASNPLPPPRQLRDMIKGVMSQVSSMKRKAREAVASELESARVVKRRVEHLQEAGTGDKDARARWESVRIDRLLTDYLLRAGCYASARKLVETRKIQNLTNLEIFETANDVEQSLWSHEVGKCLAWCQENKSRLKKLNSTLEFNLRVQEFIELVKRNERMDAVRHARKYFTMADEKQLTSVQRVMALLAFPTDTGVPEYRSLLSDDRWGVLVEEFRAENLRLFQLCPQSSFSVVLQAGLSALKTPQCYKTNLESYNPDCPVCLPALNILAKDLPFAHCSQSRLICHITGETMDENNQPLVLPSGYVYSTKALTAQAEANNGLVHCPRTNTTYQLSEAQKVFVM